MSKFLTPEIVAMLDTKLPMSVSDITRRRMASMGIKEIYYIGEKTYSKLGIGCNHLIVGFNNDFIELDIAATAKVEQILDSIS